MLSKSDFKQQGEEMPKDMRDSIILNQKYIALMLDEYAESIIRQTFY